jgi:hypothetical protein
LSDLLGQLKNQQLRYFTSHFICHYYWLWNKCSYLTGCSRNVITSWSRGSLHRRLSPFILISSISTMFIVYHQCCYFDEMNGFRLAKWQYQSKSRRLKIKTASFEHRCLVVSLVYCLLYHNRLPIHWRSSIDCTHKSA